MRIERLPGTTNVLRFPVERRSRPTLELLRQIAPDVDEVLASAEVCDLDGPVPDLRARVDAETAQHILDHFGGGGAMPHGFLDELLDPVVAAAVTACQAAHDLRIDAAETQQALLWAQTAGHFWRDPLRQRAEALTLRMADLLIQAHARAEEAEGVARAVDLARRGEAWTPRDHRAEEAGLFAMAPVGLADAGLRLGAYPRMVD